MNESVEYPGLVWVKDPINLDGQPTGAAPRRRHHEDCSHFYRASDGSMIGPAPYRASEEQMRTLPPLARPVPKCPPAPAPSSVIQLAEGVLSVSRALWNGP